MLSENFGVEGAGLDGDGSAEEGANADLAGEGVALAGDGVALGGDELGSKTEGRIGGGKTGALMNGEAECWPGFLSEEKKLSSSGWWTE